MKNRMENQRGKKCNLVSFTNKIVQHKIRTKCGYQKIVVLTKQKEISFGKFFNKGT
jgi:hypothetical protein